MRVLVGHVHRLSSNIQQITLRSERQARSHGHHDPWTAMFKKSATSTVRAAHNDRRTAPPAGRIEKHTAALPARIRPPRGLQDAVGGAIQKEDQRRQEDEECGTISMLVRQASRHRAVTPHRQYGAIRSASLALKLAARWKLNGSNTANRITSAEAIAKTARTQNEADHSGKRRPTEFPNRSAEAFPDPSADYYGGARWAANGRITCTEAAVKPNTKNSLQYPKPSCCCSDDGQGPRRAGDTKMTVSSRSSRMSRADRKEKCPSAVPAWVSRASAPAPVQDAKVADVTQPAVRSRYLRRCTAGWQALSHHQRRLTQGERFR